jgi:hypothetical protein
VSGYAPAPHASRAARIAAVAALFCGLGIASPATAPAAWGPVLRPATSAAPSSTALAVNASGDLALAWVQERAGTSAVRVFVRRNGRSARVRTVLRARHRAVQGLTVVLDGRGELTVAWVDQTQRSGLRAGPITIRAATRTPGGRWSGVQAVSRSSAYVYAQPRLAAALNGTVALTFNAGVRAAPGVAVAWRSRGHRFGRVHAVAGTGRGYLQEPTLTFDRRGRAYLAGIAGCDDPQSTGVLLTTRPGGRTFGAPRSLGGPPATHLRLVVAASGRAVASWLGAPCSTSEDLSGLVLARVLRDGALSDPVLLDGLPSRELTLTGATAGAADAAWTDYAAGAPDGRVLTTRIGADGTASPATAPADGWVATAGTRPGARIVERLRPAGMGLADAVGARGGDTAVVEPAPLDGAARFTVAAAPFGSALAAAGTFDGGLRVSAWRPSAKVRPPLRP